MFGSKNIIFGHVVTEKYRTYLLTCTPGELPPPWGQPFSSASFLCFDEFFAKQNTKTTIAKEAELVNARSKILKPGNTEAVAWNIAFAPKFIMFKPTVEMNAASDSTVACSSSATSFVRCALITEIANG